MSSNAEQYVIYRVLNAPLNEYPYPHLYIENIFPFDFYQLLRENWPVANNFVSLANTGRVSSGDYKERHVIRFTPSEIEKLQNGRQAFWKEMATWFLGKNFMVSLIDKFRPQIESRLGMSIDHFSFQPDSLIVRDHSRYEIGPHTDLPHRLLSLLFYCPQDSSRAHLGTTIYTPIDKSFTCVGGPHYPFEMFEKVVTMEYKPNSLFAFLRTNNSFHGVEPIIEDEVERDLILYNIRVAKKEGGQSDVPHRSLVERMLSGLMR
ncbi:MAG: hypothetical protein Q8L39_10325 [Burkholderiales bacterium]|nr:hypothetical protein [Burkholderiales bacterium]